MNLQVKGHGTFVRYLRTVLGEYLSEAGSLKGKANKFSKHYSADIIGWIGYNII